MASATAGMWNNFFNELMLSNALPAPGHRRLLAHALILGSRAPRQRDLNVPIVLERLYLYPYTFQDPSELQHSRTRASSTTR